MEAGNLSSQFVVPNCLRFFFSWTKPSYYSRYSVTLVEESDKPKKQQEPKNKVNAKTSSTGTNKRTGSTRVRLVVPEDEEVGLERTNNRTPSIFEPEQILLPPPPPQPQQQHQQQPLVPRPRLHQHQEPRYSEPQEELPLQEDQQPNDINMSNNVNYSNMIIKSSRVWDVRIPPVKKSHVANSFVPKFSFAFRRRRRLTIQILYAPQKSPKSTPEKKSNNNNNFYTDNTTTNSHDNRSSLWAEDDSSEASTYNEVMRGLLDGERDKDADTTLGILSEQEVVVLKILKPEHVPGTETPRPRKKKRQFMGSSSNSAPHSHHSTEKPFNDEDSLSTLGFYGATEDADDNETEVWLEQKTYDISKEVVMVSRVKNVATIVVTEPDGEKVQQHIIFSTADESRSFFKIVLSFQQSMTPEEQTRLANLRKDHPAPTPSLSRKELRAVVHLLIEVCSAWDLVAPPPLDHHDRNDEGISQRRRNLKPMDPFCEVRLGLKELHVTGALPNTNAPVWTVNTGSLFLLTTTMDELFWITAGLTFEIMNTDDYGNEYSIGHVTVPSNTALECHGKRMVFDLTPSNTNRVSNHTKNLPTVGKLAVRFRKATDSDVEFVRLLETGMDPSTILCRQLEGDTVVFGHTSPSLKGRPTLLHMSHKQGNEGEQMRYVRPGPDPTRAHETMYMTERAIEDVLYESSRDWVEAGTGSLGRLFVEVLSCDELRGRKKTGALNMTTGKVNAYAALLYEDSFLHTDVISNSNNPRWPPWSNRAFVFNMVHPSSTLKIGVVDFKENDLKSNEPIGRVTIDPARLRPGMEYMLNYTLHTDTPQKELHKPNGSVKIRVRLVLRPFRLLWSTLQAVPSPGFNVDRKLDYEVLQYVGAGTYDRKDQTLDVKLLDSYIKELFQTYHKLSREWNTVLNTTLFWRGTHVVPFTKGRLKFPLRSLVVFGVGITLLERPNLVPSLGMGVCVWVLVGSSLRASQNRRYPRPWRRQKPSYFEILVTVLFGCFPRFLDDDESSLPFDHHPDNKNHNNGGVSAPNNDDDERPLLGAKTSSNARPLVETSTSFDNEFSVSVSTDNGNHSDTQLNGSEEGSLWKLQSLLGGLSQRLRYILDVLYWEDRYASFWWTSFFAVCAVGFGFVPWGLVIGRTCRALVWILLGPWMWLVGFVHRWIQRNSKLGSQRERIRREHELKLKEMKSLLFGAHTTQIDARQLERHVDHPLPSSMAVPVDDNANDDIHVRTRMLGQEISLDMTPKLVCAPPEYHHDNNHHPSSDVKGESLVDCVPDVYDPYNDGDSAATYQTRNNRLLGMGIGMANHSHNHCHNDNDNFVQPKSYEKQQSFNSLYNTGTGRSSIIQQISFGGTTEV